MRRVNQKTIRKINSNGHLPRILLVEDDGRMSRAVSRTLEWAGCVVDVEENSVDGLKGFAIFAPDLVILDVELPDGSGFDLCRQIRKKGGPEVPILFMTVRNDLESRLEGFRAGGQDFIIKPFYLKEMVERVRIQLALGNSKKYLMLLNTELKVRDRNRMDVVDMIAHDLKLPLTTISGTIKLLASGETHMEKTSQRLLQNSDKATTVMRDMIDDIINLSKAERGLLKAHREPVRAAEVLEEVREFFQPLCLMRNMSLEMSLSAKRLLLYTDRRLLYRILMNVLSNAVKCNTPGEKIFVKCIRSASRVRFSVEDRGPGIPDKDKKRVFKKFEQLEASGETVLNSYGVGLYFCRVASDALGGQIWVEDRANGGSRFILDIPQDVGEGDD